MLPAGHITTADAALLDAFIAHGLDVPALATATSSPSLTTADVLAWLAQPHVAHALAAVRLAHTLAAKIRRARARFTAIETLEHTARTHTDPTERRRAATTLLATASPKRNPGFGVPWRRLRRYGEAPNHQPPLSHSTPHHVAEPPPRMERGTAHPVTSAGPAQTPPPRSSGEVPVIAEPSAHAALSTLAADFLSTLDADDVPESPDHDFSDAALDRFAHEFEHRLGVPVTHPDILTAVAQGRIDELDAIAAGIRARPP